MTGFSVEVFARVYNDKTGEYLEIGPDSDGLDLLEIKQVDTERNIVARMTCYPIEALALGDAIRTAVAYMRNKAEENAP